MKKLYGKSEGAKKAFQREKCGSKETKQSE